MADQDPVLLLTRPTPDSVAFLEAVRERLGFDIPAVISPLFQIKPLASAGDLSTFRTVIFSSRNAVKLVGSGLSGLSVKTVGQRTAALAAEFGATAHCLGENVEAFLKRIGEVESPAVHLRGVHSRGDLAARATSQGVAVDERVIYDQTEAELSDEAKQMLRGGHAVVPVFSPRTAQLLSKFDVGRTTRVFAISPATADAWSGAGHVTVARHPEQEALLEMIVAAL